MIAPGESARLVDAVSQADAIDGMTVRIFNQLPTGPLDERAITVDQTNTSVIVGERVVVKWMREASASARAPVLLEHLALTGFRDTPTPYAALYRGGELVATVTAYLPDALDGWDWCVDALLGHLEGNGSAEFAESIGELAGSLHAALAAPSRVFPISTATIDNPGWATTGFEVLAEAELLARTADDEDGAWLLAHTGRIADEISLSADVDATLTIHPHGDLHVGQVLKWRDGYAVTDFDGNPTLTGPTMEPAVRDVAQLRTSLLHVGEIANRRTEGRHRETINEWGARSADKLLSAYRRMLAASGHSEIFDERLLRAFEVEQECRELLYAARFLPRWRYAPMGVLRGWYGGES